MASNTVFVTRNAEGNKCYWSYPRSPPRRRYRRETAEIRSLLGLFFPMPADPGDPRDYEDESERWRIRAIHALRCELRTKVYPACDWERARNYAGDDPMDPVIDYEALKGKLSCVVNLKYAGQFGENLDWPWEALAPFNWAPHDTVHAQVAGGDEVLQRFLATGGDPVPQPTRCYVEISDE